MKFTYFTIFIAFLLSDSMQIDASNWDEWVYINLYLGQEVDPGDSPEENLGWDIACKRYHFRTNSGLSGGGNGGAYVDSVNTWSSDLYAALTQVPENSYFERDTIVNTFYSQEDGENIYGLPGIANPSLETWGWINIDNNYNMNYTDNQFIVRSGTGDKFYKLWAVNYYNQNNTSGYISIYFDEISECSIGHDDCGECGGDNSSCKGCMDINACNYDPIAYISDENNCSVDFDEDGLCDDIDVNDELYCESNIIDKCGDCDGINSCIGCSDIEACNYSDLATIDDGSCYYIDEYYDCEGSCFLDYDQDGLCDDLDGCPNNYDPYSTDVDEDGLLDACQDDDDDNDGQIDCWGFALGAYPNTVYWDFNGSFLETSDIGELIASGACGDYALHVDRDSYLEKFILSQNHPNPFNPSTEIEYFIAEPSDIDIDIFDINGRNIFTFNKGFESAGFYSVLWNGTDRNRQKMPSGIYIYQLRVNNLVIDRKKMLLLY